VLSDPDKRRVFDQVGEEGAKRAEAGGGGGGGGSGGFPGGFPGGHHQGGFHFQAGGGGFQHQDPFHMFNNMFGGGGGHGGGGGFPGRGGAGFPGGGGGGRGGPPPPPPVLYSAKGTPDVQRLTRATFNAVASRTARGQRLVLLHLYQPTSPSAQALAPALQRLASALKGALSVAAVNCATDRGVCASAQGGGGSPQDSALRLLHEGGAETLEAGQAVAALQAGKPPLRALAGVWDAVAARIPSRVGTLPASRAALDKLARRCAAPAGGGKKRAVVGCVVLFSAHGKVSPMFAALSSSPAFDAAQGGSGSGSASASGGAAPAAAAAATPAAEEGAFVFAQAEVPVKKKAAGEAAAGAAASAAVDAEHADAIGAADLGVKELPALVLLLGSSLEEWRLGGALSGEELRRAGRVGKVVAPKSALENTAAMAAWLSAQRKGLR
jgi:hypothetical protein